MLRTRLLTLVVVLPVLVAFWGEDALGQESAQGGVDGAAYTSPLFGYAISWDAADWVVVDADTREEQGDSLRLEASDADYGLFELVGFRWDREGQPQDAEGWVELLAENLGNPETSDVQQAESGGKPIGGHDAASAYAVYEYRHNDMSMVAYIECHEVTPGETGLCMRFLTSRELFNTQLPLVQEVLSTLTLPAGDLLDPHATVTPTS
jgi:hypothetical protein